MTVRQRQIWDLLAGEECLTAKEIGHHLHISDRTVRSEITLVIYFLPLLFF